MNSRSIKRQTRAGCFASCPRCGWHSFEHLATHRHCVNCLYYEPNFEDTGLADAIAAEKILKKLESKNSQKISGGSSQKTNINHKK